MAGQSNPNFFFARRNCPVCGGGESEPIYSAPLTADPVRGFIASHYANQGQVHWPLFEGTDFDILQCARCDLIYQRNVPTDETLDHIYNVMIAPDWLERLERQRLTIDNFQEIAGEMTVLFRLAGKHPSEIRFLDFGLGHARWARVARAMGARVFATETGEEKKAIAAGLGIEILSDAEIDTMRFDIVHTEQVLEHLVEPGRDFRRLAAITDGILKVAVPGRGNLRALLTRNGIPAVSPFSRNMGARLNATERAFVSIQPFEHLNAYSSRTFQWLAAQSGMTVASRVRRRAVPIELQSPALLARSVLHLGAMAAKMLVRSQVGYYLFRPAAKSAMDRPARSAPPVEQRHGDGEFSGKKAARDSSRSLCQQPILTLR